MKGIKCFGVLLLLSITVGLSLSVFSDAKAVTFSLDVEPLRNISIDKWWCKKKNDTTAYGCGGLNGSTYDFTTGVGQTSEIQNFNTLNDNYSVTENYYYEFYFSILGLDQSTYNASTGIIWQFRDSTNFAFVSVEQVIDEVYWNNQNVNNPQGFNTGYDSQNQTFRVLLRAKNTGSFPFKIGGDVSTLIYQDSLRYQRIFIYPTVNEYKLRTDGAEEMNQKDDEDRSNIESQSSDIDSGAQDTSDDLDSASSNIFEHAGAILGAFNTSATDCIISVTTGSEGALQLNNMNICNMPTEMRNMTQTILTIVVALAVLLIGWNVVRTTLEVYNEILGG